MWIEVGTSLWFLDLLHCLHSLENALAMIFGENRIENTRNTSNAILETSMVTADLFPLAFACFLICEAPRAQDVDFVVQVESEFLLQENENALD